jgi:hypothetical protein
MPNILDGSVEREGGSGDFLKLDGAQPALGPSPSTSTGYTLITDDVWRTRYASSLGNLEFNTGTVQAQPGIDITLAASSGGQIYVDSTETTFLLGLTVPNTLPINHGGRPSYRIPNFYSQSTPPYSIAREGDVWYDYNNDVYY